jgi:hypothetical protein
MDANNENRHRPKRAAKSSKDFKSKVKTRRSSNNTFPDRPAGKTRFEDTTGQSVFVPKGYCTSAVSRGKPFCDKCMLKPCFMLKDKVDFDDMSFNLENMYCRPKGYVERHLRDLARAKMVTYFGPSYVDSIPNNGVPQCFDDRLGYYIQSDFEGSSGDESDKSDIDYCRIVREMFKKK